MRTYLVRIVFCLALCAAGLSACSPSLDELEVTVVYTIGNEYALVQVSGYPPNRRLNEAMLKKLYLDYRKRLGLDPWVNVERNAFDLVVYDQGKQRGDGVRAHVSDMYLLEWEPKVIEAEDVDHAKIMEKFSVYSTDVNRLYLRLNANPTQFAQDFIGKPIEMKIGKAKQAKPYPGKICLDPVAKDPAGQLIRLCYDENTTPLSYFDVDQFTQGRESYATCALSEVHDGLALFDCNDLTVGFMPATMLE